MDNSWWDAIPSENTSKDGQTDNSWWDSIPDTESTQSKSFGDTALEGLSAIPGGLARTVERTIGAGGISSALRGLENYPKSLESGEPVTEAPPSGILDTISHYGKQAFKGVIEAAPGFAVDTGAAGAGAMAGSIFGPVGALIGGGLGAGGSYLARNYGKDLDRAQEASGTTGKDPSATEIAKVAGADLAMGALNRFGLRGGGLLGAVGSNAAAQGAGSLIDQSVIENKLDPAKVATDAALGGALGAAGHYATKLSPLPNLGLRNEIVGKAGKMGLEMAEGDKSGTIAGALSNVVRDNVDINTNKGAKKALQFAAENLRGDARNSLLPVGVREAVDLGRPIQPKVLEGLDPKLQDFVRARASLGKAFEKTHGLSQIQQINTGDSVVGNLAAIASGHPAPYHLAKTGVGFLHRFTQPSAKKMLNYYQAGSGYKIAPENASAPPLTDIRSATSAKVKITKKNGTTRRTEAPKSGVKITSDSAPDDFSTGPIRNQGAYQKAVAARQGQRQTVFDDVRANVSPEIHGSLNDLQKQLNEGSVRSPAAAKETIGLYLKDIPKEHRDVVRQALLSGKLLSTFVNKGSK
jgi:hypothetical protein